MTPLEFLQRLAALVPRPRLHLIRFHDVLAPNAALRPQIVPGDPDQATAPSNEPGDSPSASTRTRMSWAQLLKRVFAIDMATCPQCGGPLSLIAAIEDPAVIIKILSHLGLPTALHHEPRPGSTRSCRQPNPSLDSGSVPEPTFSFCPDSNSLPPIMRKGWPDSRKMAPAAPSRRGTPAFQTVTSAN